MSDLAHAPSDTADVDSHTDDKSSDQTLVQGSRSHSMVDLSTKEAGRISNVTDHVGSASASAGGGERWVSHPRPTMEARQYSDHSSGSTGRMSVSSGRTKGEDADGQTVSDPTKTVRGISRSWSKDDVVDRIGPSPAAVDPSPNANEDEDGTTSAGILQGRRRPTPLHLGNESNMSISNVTSAESSNQPGSTATRPHKQIGPDSNRSSTSVRPPGPSFGPTCDSNPSFQIISNPPNTERAPSPRSTFSHSPIIGPAGFTTGPTSSPYAYSYAMRQQQHRARAQVGSAESVQAIGMRTDGSGSRSERDGYGWAAGGRSVDMQRSGSGRSLISPGDETGQGSYGNISPGELAYGRGGFGGVMRTMTSTSTGGLHDDLATNAYPSRTSHGNEPQYHSYPSSALPGQAFSSHPYTSYPGSATDYSHHSTPHQPSSAFSFSPWAANGNTPPGSSSVGLGTNTSTASVSRYSHGYRYEYPVDPSGVGVNGGEVRMEDEHGSRMAALVDRPFKCDECTQSFSRNHDLKRHKRIHLAVKPFACEKCGKQFSRKDALRRHWLVKGCRSENSTGINPEFRASKVSAASTSNPTGLSQPAASATSYFPGYATSFPSPHGDGSAQASHYHIPRLPPLERNFPSDASGPMLLTPQDSSFPFHQNNASHQRFNQYLHRPSTIGPLDTGSSASSGSRGGYFPSPGIGGVYRSINTPTGGPDSAGLSYPSSAPATSHSFAQAWTPDGRDRDAGYDPRLGQTPHKGPDSIYRHDGGTETARASLGKLDIVNDNLPPGMRQDASAHSRTASQTVLVMRPDGMVEANIMERDPNGNLLTKRESRDYYHGAGGIGMNGTPPHEQPYSLYPAYQKPSNFPQSTPIGRTTSINGPNSQMTAPSMSPANISHSSFNVTMSRQSSLNPASRQIGLRGMGESGPSGDGSNQQMPRWHRPSFPFPVPSHLTQPRQASAVESSQQQQSPEDRQQAFPPPGQGVSGGQGGRQWNRASFPFPATQGIAVGADDVAGVGQQPVVQTVSA